MNIFALCIFLLWGLLSIASSFFVDEANQIQLAAIFAQPFGSDHYLLGADELGRSLGLRLISGAQASFSVAAISVIISATLGSAIGIAAGYFSGITDRLISRMIDVFLAFPGLLLAIALAAVLGPGLDNVIIALCAMGWVGYARLARAQVLSLKQRDHVSAAVAQGVPSVNIMWRHLLPLMFAPLLVEVSYGIASAVIAEAGLSFLGLGIQPPDASWGSMIREGVRYLLVAPHLVIVPGVALSLVVFASNILGDSLRDQLDVVTSRNRH